MNSPHNTSGRGRAVSERVGFYMWRGGLIFCAVYAAYESVAWIVDAIIELGVPLQIAFGVAFLVVGFGMLLGSLIVERVIDARAEQGLKDM